MALTCKNDPSRKYAGTEPSPKGLGYCAHAAPEGSTRKGKDGRQWTVRVDKNGTKAWKPASASKARPTLTFSMSGEFSDGTALSYSVGQKPEIYTDDEYAPLTRAHLDAVVSSKSPVTLRLDRGALLPIDVKIAAPVTAGKVVAAMQKFYSTKLSATDYKVLEADLPNWNPLHVGKTIATFKKAIRTYADCKGDHTAFSGFHRSRTSVYEPEWSS